LADIGSCGEDLCTVSSLYEPNLQYRKYGWIDNRFVSDVELYGKYRYLDGQSPFVWRQGVKHDAVKIMVLAINAEGSLYNGLHEYVDIEKDLLYPFIKGSEIQEMVIKDTARRVIITQSSPSEDTGYIALRYPRLWAYLISHSKYLDRHKSMIYQRRPRFSIFGIGEYSFKPYKVAISGLYKKPNFCLVFPIGDKPVMLDDTCYCLSFDTLNDAFFTWVLLNVDKVKKFLSSIVFLDSKRPYTKEVLMRINILKLVDTMSFEALFNIYQEKLKTYLEHEFNERDFLNFQSSLKRD
jgi:hypothetical protein